MGRMASKSTVEGRLCLDIHALKKQKCLQPNIGFSWSWSRNGKKIAEIWITTYEDRLQLKYSKDNEPMKYDVGLTFTDCNYGGQRPWLVCPHCFKRVGKLYMGHNGRFNCRTCLGLVYISQRQQDYDRLLDKAQSIHRRLGGSGVMYDHVSKPKQMHWKTYFKLRNEAHRVWEKSLGIAVQRFKALG